MSKYRIWVDRKMKIIIISNIMSFVILSSIGHIFVCGSPSNPLCIAIGSATKRYFCLQRAYIFINIRQWIEDPSAM